MIYLAFVRNFHACLCVFFFISLDASLACINFRCTSFGSRMNRFTGISGEISYNFWQAYVDRSYLLFQLIVSLSTGLYRLQNLHNAINHATLRVSIEPIRVSKLDGFHSTLRRLDARTWSIRDKFIILDLGTMAALRTILRQVKITRSQILIT